jgi:hypothetical protein
MTNLERIKNNSAKEIAELFDKIYIYGSKGENLFDVWYCGGVCPYRVNEDCILDGEAGCDDLSTEDITIMWLNSEEDGLLDAIGKRPKEAEK